MPTSPARSPYVFALLLLGLALLAAGGCANIGPALPQGAVTPQTTAAPQGAGFVTPAGSVQDQLAQLAAGAQPAASSAAASPQATAQIAAADAQPSQPTAAVTATRTPRATRTPTATKQPTSAAGVQATRPPRPTRTPTAAPKDGLATVTLAKLPPEAQTTVRLIQQGGPFPYRRDGVTFENREGRLPKRASGYYREYTVVTPGSVDRGARRIIAGQGGELYYTDDHYDTFKRVILP